ncbi:MAG: multidrug resistance efflux pump [Paraglaciecola sp.]|jgi:multidrug resistance efflux pump
MPVWASLPYPLGQPFVLLRQAANTLKNARLQIYYADVRSEVAGHVANLQLQPGNHAQAGSPVAAVVVEQGDIVADFREKSLSHVQLGDDATVVFDAFPGKVFAAKVESIDAGVKDGQINADGALANPVNSDRWVRDAQYMRTHLALVDEPGLLQSMPSGARATVQLHPIGGLAAG